MATRHFNAQCGCKLTINNDREIDSFNACIKHTWEDEKEYQDNLNGYPEQ